jgi:hypothetical protein
MWDQRAGAGPGRPGGGDRATDTPAQGVAAGTRGVAGFRPPAARPGPRWRPQGAGKRGMSMMLLAVLAVVMAIFAAEIAWLASDG